MFEKAKDFVLIGALVALAGLAVFDYMRGRVHDAQSEAVRNQLALADKTHETDAGSYTRLSTENESRKSELASVQKQLDQTKQSLVAEQQVSLTWKKKYSFVLSHQAKPPEAGPPEFGPPAVQAACTPTPQTYNSVQDLGWMKLSLDTFTVDPSYQQHLDVLPGDKPLGLTLDLSRDKGKQWHYTVTPSDPRLSVNIDRANISLDALNTHWWERIWVNGGAGVSNTAGIVDAGVDYEFGRYQLGPHLWQTVPGTRYYGLHWAWAPFKQKE